MNLKNAILLVSLLLTACGGAAPAPQVTATPNVTATSQPTATVTHTPTASATPTPAMPAEFDLSTIEGIEGFAVFNPDKTATVTIGGEKFEGVHLDGVVKQIDAKTMQVMGWYARLDGESGKWTIDMRDVIKVLAPRPGADGKLTANPEDVLPHFDNSNIEMIKAYFEQTRNSDMFKDGTFQNSWEDLVRPIDHFKQINAGSYTVLYPADGDDWTGGFFNRAKDGGALPIQADFNSPAIFVEQLGGLVFPVGLIDSDSARTVFWSMGYMQTDNYADLAVNINPKFSRNFHPALIVYPVKGDEMSEWLTANNMPVLETFKTDKRNGVMHKSIAGRGIEDAIMVILFSK